MTGGKFSFLAAGFFLILLIKCSIFAIIENHKRGQLLSSMKEIAVLAPQVGPEPGQDAVDLAMALFSVDKPNSMQGPFFDPQLWDRGLTVGGTVSPVKWVSVGPSAFSSWAVLGSTLGHEIEVHVAQSFFLIVLQDSAALYYNSTKKYLTKFFLDLAMPSAANAEVGHAIDMANIADQSEKLQLGTWKAEREAYKYELTNSKRFGLNHNETRSIKKVMNHYYPD